MERRALIAVVISLAILVLYQELVIKRYFGEPVSRPEAEAPPPTAPSAPTQPAVVSPEAPPPAIIPEGREVVIETDLYRAVLTTAGARLRNFQLKHYRATVDKASPALDAITDAVRTDLPLGIELRAASKSITDTATVYRVDRDQLALADGASGAVSFVGEVDGITITKRFEARADSYLLGLDLKAEGATGEYVEMAIGWHKNVNGTHPLSAEKVFDSIIAIKKDKLQQVTWEGLDTLAEDDIRWLGYSGRYFLAALVPSTAGEKTARMWLKRRDPTLQTKLILPPGELKSHIDIYVGPKEIGILESTGHSLRRAVDLGWFTFIALPLLQLLKLSHRLTGNYGVDIILLTVMIKILFIPLTQKSLKSMREMQKLQPQMAKIRERLKDHPDEMNKEVMELYRRHKVNPLGGCLPMVLQIPVFVGLYNALLNAVELRHASFAGWINDLSAPDRLGTVQLPYVEQPGIPILTLLMGVSMFWQQWMTPSTGGDPAQQRVMLIMPVIFTFMFINFPSGLTLYWLVNNILTIAQQYVINRPAR